MKIEFLPTFLVESEEILSDIDEALFALEDHSGDNQELVHRLFRGAHTLKGGAAIIDMPDFVNFAHATEFVLDKMRDGLLDIDQAVIDVLFKSAHVLQDMLSAAANGENEFSKLEGYQATLEQLQALSGDEPIAQVAAGSQKYIRIDITLEDTLSDLGDEPIEWLQELETLGSICHGEVCVAGLPSLSELDANTCYIQWKLVLETETSWADVNNIFMFSALSNTIDIEDITDSYTSSKNDTGPAEAVEDAPAKTVDATAPNPQQPAQQPARAPTESRKIQPVGRDSKSILANGVPTMRVDVPKLDRLVTLIGELTISIEQTSGLLAGEVQLDVDENPRERQKEMVENLRRLNRELQDTALELRLVPLHSTFTRFKRMVRELASKLGKNIKCELVGTDVQLDKNLVEKLADPLVHLVRNSVDHGVETPEERAETDKSKAATVVLRALQDGTHTIIEISDDGRGINADKVLELARQRGVYTGSERPSDKEIYQFLFAPGFSTAETVTDVSGRGVGLDVVRRNIEDLRGDLDVDSTPGQGTTFRMSLPLTLSIIDGMNIRVGDEKLTIPLQSIIHQLRPKPGDLHSIDGNEASTLLEFDGDYLPLLRLDENLGYQYQSSSPQNGIAVILESKRGPYAILVDAIDGQQQAVLKPLESNYARLPGFCGATILADGSLSLIIEVDELYKTLGSNAGDGASARN